MDNPRRTGFTWLRPGGPGIMLFGNYISERILPNKIHSCSRIPMVTDPQRIWQRKKIPPISRREYEKNKRASINKFVSIYPPQCPFDDIPEFFDLGLPYLLQQSL